MEEITLENVERIVEQLSPEDQQRLVEHLAGKLQNGAAQGALERKPRDLYGIWQGKFPAELDVEKEIRAIRAEWKEELEEFGP